MKRLVLVSVLFLLISCKKEPAIKVENGAVKLDSVVEPVKSDNPEKINTIFLLVPGTSAGIVNLNANSETLSTLGKPDMSDAAMGKSWMTWYGGHGTQTEELNIYTTYKDNEMKEKVVKLIRVTSAEYKTKDSLGSGNTKPEISKIFPQLQLAAKYKNTAKKEVAIYDATSDGIAFEFVNDTCKGTIIHEKGRKVTDTYITLHPDMKKF
ncbi:hypothetical protein [Flavobacterium sp. 3HN19-14]|uniref:hypothetical protein n=1 Tax=Flavobacterium sp. 3HN19-14 TaxID=3448133 RepID=UPI003EE1B38C